MTELLTAAAAAGLSGELWEGLASTWFGAAAPSIVDPLGAEYAGATPGGILRELAATHAGVDCPLLYHALGPVVSAAQFGGLAERALEAVLCGAESRVCDTLTPASAGAVGVAIVEESQATTTAMAAALCGSLPEYAEPLTAVALAADVWSQRLAALLAGAVLADVIELPSERLTAAAMGVVAWPQRLSALVAGAIPGDLVDLVGHACTLTVMGGTCGSLPEYVEELAAAHAGAVGVAIVDPVEPLTAITTGVELLAPRLAAVVCGVVVCDLVGLTREPLTATRSGADVWPQRLAATTAGVVSVDLVELAAEAIDATRAGSLPGGSVEYVEPLTAATAGCLTGDVPEYVEKLAACVAAVMPGLVHDVIVFATWSGGMGGDLVE